MTKAVTPLIKSKGRYMSAFFIAMVCAAALFVPYMIIDKGYFLFYGDFNVQQVPFYKLAHEAVRSGNWGWSFGTDLGTNFIGSYTFYLLGSPFFWLTLPFPNDFVPHLMGPLLILKFSFASLTAYAFLSRFLNNKDFALIGGLLYAFSGFSVYNIFFNHFHEAIVYFPLLLLSLELLVKDNRRGFFAIVVFLCALSNYYFFFGMVIFTVIYFFLRSMSGDWKMTFKKFMTIAFEAVLGVIMSAVFLLPSVLMILQNDRVGSYLTNWNGLLYTKYQRYGYIFQCFFFPPDLPARPVFFTETDAKWSSVAGWLPVFGMTGVIAYCFGKRGTWLKRILITSAVFAFIPILNASFSAFNYSYYARWFYMPVLMMVLMSVKSLEDPEIDWRKGWIWSFFITLAITLGVGFYPQGQYADGSFSGFGLYDEKYADRFWITCAIALGALAVFGILLLVKKQSIRMFTRATIAAVCIFSIGYGSMFIGLGKQSSYDTDDFIIPYLLEGQDTVVLEGENIADIDDCRIDVYESMDNIGMFMGVSSVNAFHSVVSSSIFDYYDFIGVERVVGSRPEADDKNYALRALLSVKYVFDYAGDSKPFADEYDLTEMPGYKLDSTQDGFDIYVNEYFIPYGFTYDYYVPKSYCETLGNSDRQHMMLKALVLEDEEIEKYSDILTDIRGSVAEDGASYIPATEAENVTSSEGENTSSLVSSESGSTDVTVIEQSAGSALAGSSSDTSSDESVKIASVPDVSIGSGDTVLDIRDDESSLVSVEEEPEEKDPYANYVFKSNVRLYKQDCKARAATACLTFETDNKGFTAVTSLNRDNLVFFSIPYDEGWSATVDGEPAEIVRANVGFMAVKVKGDGVAHTIRFDYNTPGLSAGIKITIGAFAILVVYLIICLILGKKKKEMLTTASVYTENTADEYVGKYSDENIDTAFKPLDTKQTDEDIINSSNPYEEIGGIRPTSYLGQFNMGENTRNRFVKRPAEPQEVADEEQPTQIPFVDEQKDIVEGGFQLKDDIQPDDDLNL